MADRDVRDSIRSQTKENIVKRFVAVIMSVIVMGAILLFSSGKMDWVYAWVYIAASLMAIIINAFILPAELVAERGRRKENVEPWDRLISGLTIVPWFATYLFAGLDIRFEWSGDWAPWLHGMGIVMFAFGNALVTWAMTSNPFFSTAVRIQYDRGHSVSLGGPYRFIRHPGYLGMTMYLLAGPLVLGSMWALFPAGLTVALIIIRTALEDHTLQLKLEHYDDYTDKVRYRLIPGLW